MVTIYATLVFRHFMPEPWMEWALCGACLAFDLLVVRNAPDIRLTKADIEAKLAGGAEPVFLTWGEVKTRLAWLTLGALLLTAVAWYWFSHDQQPVLLSEMLIGGIILAVIAYISALGIPLRTQRHLKEGEKGFVMPLFPLPSRIMVIYVFSYPPFMLTAILIIWGAIVSIAPSFGGLGWTGTFSEYMGVVLTGYGIMFQHMFCSQLLIIDQKIKRIT